MSGITVSDLVDVFECCFFNWGFLTVILPAFIMASGITVFVDPMSVITRIGAGSKKWLSYVSASLAGYVIPVCSCNIVPLFDSLTRKGASVGPAYTFLYAAPAVHIINLVFTWNVIGPFLAIGRLIGVFIISILVGLSMSFLFEGKNAEESASTSRVKYAGPLHPERPRTVWILLGLLLGLIMLGSILTVPGKALGGGISYYPYVLAGFILLVIGFLAYAHKMLAPGSKRDWVRETTSVFRMIVPYFLIGVFLAALVAKVIPLDMARRNFIVMSDDAGNPLWSSNFRCSLLGATIGEVIYFPILTEVAFVKALLKEGLCSVSTAMALLLAGPGTSLPGLVLIYRFQGFKRVAAYFFLSILFQALFAMLFGQLHYTCACKFL